MSSFRDEKMKELIKKLAAEFLQTEAGPASLITVTGATWNDRSNSSTVFFTTFPDDKEHTALEFAKRKKAEFRDYFKSHSRTRTIPVFDFAIDVGEKNRQRIDTLSNNT